MIEVASPPREQHQCHIDHADRRSDAACQVRRGLGRARSAEQERGDDEQQHRDWAKRCSMIDSSDDPGQTQWNRCSSRSPAWLSATAAAMTATAQDKVPMR
jgi:hypothetical protein